MRAAMRQVIVMILILGTVFATSAFSASDRTVIAVLYKISGETRMAQYFEHTPLSKVVEYCPPGDSRDFTYWGVSPSHKIKIEPRTFRITLTVADIKGTFGDSLQYENPDSASTYNWRFR